MNLSAILDKRSSSIKREHIDLLHELYFQFNKHDLLHWGVDFTHRLDKDPSSDKGDGIDNLDTDGFLKVEDFGLDDAVLNSLTDTSDSRDFKQNLVTMLINRLQCLFCAIVAFFMVTIKKL